MKIESAISQARSLWYRRLGRWGAIDASSWIHWSVDIRQERPRQIELGSRCCIERHTWLNVPTAESPDLCLRLGAGCGIGRNNVISAKNSVELGEAVVTAPQVLIMDHAHEFGDVTVPILHQGVTEGGTVVIETGCWIGFGACVVSNRGELRIGRNSVVAANSVVTSSVPPMTVVAGAPARPVRTYSESTGRWERVEGPCLQAK